ncbi:hypothetical protein [Stieleria varia]|uniref:TraB family protein n=1 Tax=Stieleria varia TaxID=2528005 RepID=A0A5C6ADY4_9BACT|nr:hypothetical protein [Stieleria varia]TWT98262.1 hypothetical protein Pla52n_47720 [Stieleria varia]
MRWIVLLLFVFASIADAAMGLAQSAVAPVAEKESATEKKADGGDQAKADAAKKESELYLRIENDAKGKPHALQTAIVRFEGQPGSRHDGAVVDLVGVVHIGEKDYYKDLDQRLGTYQTVLYELVAPDGTRIRPEDLKGRRGMLASMQTGMKDMLNLQYQLERIDYMAENFRHADMSPEEFSEDLERRGDAVWKMVARMMGAGLASQSSSSGDVGMLFAMFSDNRSQKMKQVMARQLIDMESVTTGINDENGENTLIKGRNAKAFKILKEELDAGKENIAVFYGAGHLSDMAKRLEQDFQMKATKTTWLTAWDLSKD